MDAQLKDTCKEVVAVDDPDVLVFNTIPSNNFIVFVFHSRPIVPEIEARVRVEDEVFVTAVISKRSLEVKDLRILVTVTRLETNVSSQCDLYTHLPRSKSGQLETEVCAVYERLGRP